MGKKGRLRVRKQPQPFEKEEYSSSPFFVTSLFRLAAFNQYLLAPD
jgi:hypothetical protein